MTAYMVFLLDVSGSMQGKRISKLAEAVRAYLRELEGVKLLCFASDVTEIASLDALPDPHGGTELHLALDRALEFAPGKVVVFSDGEPSDQDACLASAARLPGVVDTIFCGSENDMEAIRFMERLARDNGGSSIVRDIAKNQSLMGPEVRKLLGLPAPIAL